VLQYFSAIFRTLPAIERTGGGQIGVVGRLQRRRLLRA